MSDLITERKNDQRTNDGIQICLQLAKCQVSQTSSISVVVVRIRGRNKPTQLTLPRGSSDNNSIGVLFQEKETNFDQQYSIILITCTRKQRRRCRHVRVHRKATALGCSCSGSWQSNHPCKSCRPLSSSLPLLYTEISDTMHRYRHRTRRRPDTKTRTTATATIEKHQLL